MRGPSTSHEVRWFGRGEAPGAVVRWFESGPVVGSGPVHRAEPREDVYARLPGGDDLGLKWRGASARQLEAKGRLRVLGEQRFGDAVHGRIEQWAKWSIERVAFDPPSPSVSVRKERLERLAALLPGGAVDAVRPGPDAPHLGRGIQAELTALCVEGERWWTVGFEAFPSDAAMPVDFAHAVSRCFSGDRGVELPLAACMGYAQWLDARGGSA